MAKLDIYKWYEKYNTWRTVISVLTPLATGEIAAFYGAITLPEWFHYIAGTAATLVLFVKLVFTDANNNGIVDKFEKEPVKKDE